MLTQCPRALLLPTLLALVLVGCDPNDATRNPADFAIDPGPSPYPLDDVLRLNHVQAKGTHNSYHIEPEHPLDPSHRYSHAPLDVQLENHGVRQFELDIHYRRGVGFEVFHIPLIDEDTTCRLFADCLRTIKEWSDHNPWHLPIAVWIEPKDEQAGLDAELQPLTGKFGDLEEEILSVWPRERLLVPDDVRGLHPDLPSALRSDGWPTLGRLRGKAIFALLDRERHRDEYTEGAANLAGRVMFVAADSEKDPFAGFFKINNAQQEAERVRRVVEAGFIVTSNVDGPTNSDEHNQAKLDASLAAGIHFGSSDFPAKVDGRGYWFDLPGGAPARCNPVFPVEACGAEDIETLSWRTPVAGR